MDKLKTTLAKARAVLSVSALMFGSAVVDGKSDAHRGIGYQALAAILEVDDPTKGTNPKPTQDGTMSMPPPKRGPLPPTPGLPSPEFYAPRVSSLAPDAAFEHRPTLQGSTHNTGSNRSHTTSQRGSDRSSIAIDSVSDTTDITSILTLHQQMDSVNSNMGDQVPKQAIRMKADPSKAPRWRPKHMGYVPDSSNLALASAVQQKDTKMVEQLLDCGVTPENSLVGTAITNHDLQTLQLLLAFGASATIKDADGATPLHTATKHFFYEAAQLLIKYGAQTETSGPNGETPLAMCFTGNRFNFAMLYLQYGADCNAPMSNGETAFTQAMNQTTSLSLAEAMLIYEADANAKNEHGESLMSIRAVKMRIIHGSCSLEFGLSAV